ncbi:MAG TPA: hypothetical protein DCG57_01490 [Candidatus Riflebacteria bacterium]|nr:hypothetical protein [Candidatus Riflebacteria bacterium]
MASFISRWIRTHVSRENACCQFIADRSGKSARKFALKEILPRSLKFVEAKIYTMMHHKQLCIKFVTRARVLPVDRTLKL